jgi:hypothetical protein
VRVPQQNDLVTELHIHSIHPELAPPNQASIVGARHASPCFQTTSVFKDSIFLPSLRSGERPGVRFCFYTDSAKSILVCRGETASPCFQTTSVFKDSVLVTDAPQARIGFPHGAGYSRDSCNTIPPDRPVGARDQRPANRPASRAAKAPASAGGQSCRFLAPAPNIPSDAGCAAGVAVARCQKPNLPCGAMSHLAHSTPEHNRTTRPAEISSNRE